MKKIVLLTLFLAFATVQAAPNPKYQAKYAAAAAAYQKQDFQAAFKILLPLAQQGDKTAQNNVAVLYLDGLGIPKNPKMALMWFAKAAAQGEAEAQFMAGLMYSEGNGTAQDYAKAAQWYEKAAQQGHADAMNNLAARYATGTGVKKDLNTAKNWYKKAAAAGNSTAAKMLQQLQSIQ